MRESPEAAGVFHARAAELSAAAPDIPEWAAIYFAAWSSLRDDRAHTPSGAIGQIFYSSISAYARDAGLIGDDARLFQTFVRALDAEYVAWVNKQIADQMESLKRG